MCQTGCLFGVIPKEGADPLFFAGEMPIINLRSFGRRHAHDVMRYRLSELYPLAEELNPHFSYSEGSIRSDLSNSSADQMSVLLLKIVPYQCS